MMDKIYNLIGRIMENCQYIEHNLALTIRLHDTLKSFYAGKIVSADVFEKAEQEAIELHKKMQSWTMGRINRLIDKHTDFNRDFQNDINKVVSDRKHIAHHYFNDCDFVKNHNDELFLQKEYGYLDDILKRLTEVNSALHEIIADQHDDLKSIK